MAPRRAILALLMVVVTAGACGDLPVARQSPGATTGHVTAGTQATPTPTGMITPKPVATGIAARVLRVVDGDTLKVAIGGRTDTVRVIGLDTPESVKAETPIECFALRASAEAERLLPVGASIRLEADPTQADRDRYGRLLAHVWLADGTLYAERMIVGGFGIHDVYEGVPSIHASRLAAAEAQARAALRGLWSPGTCAGNAHTPAP